jgi:SAM-dependent methyltransferase
MALGWNSADTQQIRFQVLTRIADLSRHSVLDLGCGRGDLRPFLGERFAQIRYTGMEQIEEFIQQAQKSYGGLPNTTFILGNFCTTGIPDADYVFASGSLNYKQEDPDFIFKMIEKLFLSCKAGLAFNLLCEAGSPPGELAAYDPDSIRSFCLGLTKKVEIIDGYLEGDFTVFMKKNVF